jgi:ubiquinone biosynthesis protein UbiJ
MRAKVGEVSGQLVCSLRTHFEREIERSLQHINETIAPYTRFVRAEGEKMRQMQATLEDIRRESDRLRARIEEL